MPLEARFLWPIVLYRNQNKKLAIALGRPLSDVMALVATDGALAAMPRGKSQLGVL